MCICLFVFILFSFALAENEEEIDNDVTLYYRPSINHKYTVNSVDGWETTITFDAIDSGGIYKCVAFDSEGDSVYRQFEVITASKCHTCLFISIMFMINFWGTVDHLIHIETTILSLEGDEICHLR